MSVSFSMASEIYYSKLFLDNPLKWVKNDMLRQEQISNATFSIAHFNSLNDFTWKLCLEFQY